ncbi:putative Zinc finger, RING/FYVE/PHD-type [Helianthus annuus]|nr:putative Zinc finger, RING/FYVE/PHD-type [Helianthus annuus]
MLRYVPCSLCNETVEPEILAVHQSEKCPQRIVTCEYCDFLCMRSTYLSIKTYAAIGPNSVTFCHRYIRLREIIAHEATCNGASDPHDSAEASRGREAERGGDGRRRPPPQDFTRRRLGTDRSP